MAPVVTIGVTFGDHWRVVNTVRDRQPVYLWDDEAEHPVGVLDMTLDGWSYIRYGPEYDYVAAFQQTVFTFAQMATNLVNNVHAANAPIEQIVERYVSSVSPKVDVCEAHDRYGGAIFIIGSY